MKQAKEIQSLPIAIPLISRKAGTIYPHEVNHSVWRVRISISALFFLMGIIGVAQNNSLVMNGAFVRMNAGTKTSPIYLVVDNANTTGIVRTANGGHIHSENQWDIVKWNSATGTGNYIIPFGVGGNPANYIPFTFNKTTAGNSNIATSTWGTNQQNMPHPDTSNLPAVNIMDCPNMNSTGDSVTAVIDRFWDIKSASTVTANVTFSYLATENTTVNSTGTFKAEHWNGTTWDVPVGPGNAGVTTGIGTVGPVAGQSTFSPWTLVNIPPPLMITNTVTTICSGTAVTFTASGASTYTWSTNAGSATTATISVSPTVTDTFTVTGTSSTGCTSTQTVSVNVNATPVNPTVTASSYSYCQGQAITPITASGTGTILWYNNAGLTPLIFSGSTYTPSSTIGTTTYYLVDSSTGGGCKSIGTVTVSVTVNPIPASPTVTTSTYTYCQSQTVGTLSANGTGTILWSTNAGMNPVINMGNTYTPTGLPVGTTTYYLTDSLNTGCKSAGTTTVSVLINPTPIDPTLSAPSYTYCQGDPISPITASGTGTILWYNNAGLTPLIFSGSTYTPASTIGTTTYYLVDSATGGGCKSVGTVSVSVTINATPTNPTVTAPGYTYCQGQVAGVVTATGSGGGTILWSTNSSMNPIVHVGSTYTPSSSTPGTTVYYIQDSSNAGCKSSAAATTVTVTVYPTPTVSGVPSIDSSKCGANNGGVNGGIIVNGGTPGYHYQWYNGSSSIPGDTLLTLNNVGGGSYSIAITDANGCVATGGITSFTVPASVAVVASFTPSISQGQAPLNITFNNASTGATFYNWNLGNGATYTVTTPAYTYSTGGTYTVLLTASNGGCLDTATAIIVVDAATTIIIPNIFSPNGDGLNDEFIITCTGMKTLNCDIFNRWGQLVFTLMGPNQSWDGSLNNGNHATEGTYYFMLNAVGYDGKTYTYQGPITLVK